MKREMEASQINQGNDSNDSKLIELAFASEQPVLREFGEQILNEILLCSPENVDLSRLQNKAAVLFNHDKDNIIGVVESSSIDADKVCRASIRLSSTADKYQTMVEEGILTKVSVGYSILDYRIDGDNLLATKWQPFEISLVSIPADDIQSGIGRSLEEVQESTESEQEPEQEIDNQESESTDVEQSSTESEPEIESTDEQKSEEEQSSTDEPEPDQTINTEEQEQERQMEIEALGKLLNKDVSRYLESNLSLRDITNELKNSNDDKEITMENNLSKAIRSLIDNSPVEGVIEGERGYVVDLQRDTTTTNAAGVVVRKTADSYIDQLWAQSVLGKVRTSP